MINQEEYLRSQPPSHEINCFIDNLLQQSNIAHEFFAQQSPQTIKQQIELQVVDSESQLKSPLSINILEKQECHPIPPQRFFEYVGDAEEQIGESQEQPPIQDSVPIKKNLKANKLSYLEETRATKIQRYKQKKTRRIWNRKISYGCRKVVADNRERVNGRFVKKSPINLSSESLHKASIKTKDQQVLKQFIESEKAFQDFNL